MKKQPKVTEATRQAFIDTFCELCKTKPMDKITVQELTYMAGYNRCTFYAYFNNVYDLLRYIEDVLILSVEKTIFEIIRNIDSVDKFLYTFINWQKEHEKYMEILLLYSNNSNFSKRLKSVMIPAYMEKYNIAKSDRESQYILEYHITGIIGLMTKWITNKRNITMHQLGDVVRGLLSEGVLKMLEKK